MHQQTHANNGNHMMCLYTYQCRKSFLSKCVTSDLMRNDGLSTKIYICDTLTHLQPGSMFLTPLFLYCGFSQLPCCTVFLESEKVVITFPT